MDVLFNSLSPAQQHTLLEGPAIPPPPGILPNFSDPSNSRYVGWIITILGATLSTIAVSLRIYSRIRYMKQIVIEDYLTITALAVFAIFEFYVMRIVIYPGYYVHTWDMQLKNLSSFLFNLYTGATIHGVVIMLLKAAILLELVRVFSPHSRGWFFWSAHTLLWLNVVFYTTCTFVEIFACQPREKLWDRLLPGGHCINSNALTLASSIINLPSDIFILVLPQRTIWKLNLSRRKRLGISAIFAVAIFACISAGIRLAASITVLNSKDILYYSAPVGIWIQAEITAGFLILGIPAMPKIFKNTPWLQRCIVLVSSWVGSSVSQERANSKKGLPSWYKPERRKRQHREQGWSALDLTENGSTAMQSIETGSGTYKGSDLVAKVT